MGANNTSLADSSNEDSSDELEILNYERLYCFGGFDEYGIRLSSGSHFDPSAGKWSHFGSMTTPRCSFGGAVIGSKIYICGGYSADRRLDTLEVYDLKLDKWTSLQSMPEIRTAFGIAAMDGFIYVAGGLNYLSKPLTSVVRYSVATNEWQPVSPMKTPGFFYQLIELNGYLYAIGGLINSENFGKVVERYDPKANEWTIVQSTKYNQFGSSATTHNGKIYVCGRWAFEVYSPETDTWTTLARLNDHFGRSLVSLNGKLWSVGGGFFNRGTKLVFEFDESTGKWNQLPDIDVARTLHCSFVVSI